MITLVIIMIFAAGFLAMADKPAYTGVKYPAAVDGKTGSVTGRVTVSTNSTGVAGAYIAVVNASNVSQEYCNTTSGADGRYQIIGINASYNATNLSEVGPNGKLPYMIYAYLPNYGDGYSAAFGIDSSGDNGPSSGTGNSQITQIAVAVYQPSPTPVASATPVPASTGTPTPSPTPVTESTTGATATLSAPTPTPTPTTPAPAYLFSLASLLFAGCVAIGLASRHKKN